MNSIYEIYDIRLLQIQKLEKETEENDCTSFKRMVKKNLKLKRIMINKRLKKINGNDLSKLTDEEFNKEIKSIFESLTISDEKAIKTDFSYNFAHIDEFRNAAIADYKN